MLFDRKRCQRDSERQLYIPKGERQSRVDETGGLEVNK